MARHRVTTIDWIMLLLAVVSVGLLAYETWGDPTPAQTQQILLTDYIIVAIFAIEFAIRWAQDDNKKTFLWRNWYDLLGMIPAHSPALRGFRLFRILRIVVLLSRFARATDRALGQEFVFQLAGRFKAALVDAISGAVTLRVLAETEEVLMKGLYAKNLADAIEERGDEILDIVVEKVAADAQVGRIRHVPFFEDIVGTSSKVTQRILIDLLRDDRMGDLFRDIIRQNTQQIMREVTRKEREAKAQARAAGTAAA
jgi:hypothetical protein